MYTSNDNGYPERWDVLVIGAGNAGLCAAITAAEAGCSVLVLEAAPRDMRGGNTRHTRNLRAMHEEPTDVLTDAYSFEEYFEDLMRVTRGVTNKELAGLTLEKSAELTSWLGERGVRFQPALSGTLNLGRTNAFFLGGGRALLNSLCRHAEGLGVALHYDTEVADILIDDGFCEGVRLAGGETVPAKKVITTAGGFEANLDWLAEGWGEAAKNFLVRGTPWNTGTVLKSLLDQGVKPVGALDQCHAVAIDARAPKYDGGIASRIDGVPFGIVLNRDAERFYDEGEDFWPKRYAIWGRLIAKQPGQVAYSIIDSQSHDLFMPTVYPALEADSIGELAELLGLPVNELEATVAQFNHAVRRAEFNAEVLDDCRTEGLAVEKSHWARSLTRPPYRAWPLRPGITFTYMGVKVDEKARVQWHAGKTSQNLWAAGEIMAGNILGQGYLAGIGITIGNVFGRIAGREAALYAA